MFGFAASKIDSIKLFLNKSELNVKLFMFWYVCVCVNELVSPRTVTGWIICMDYKKLNKTTRKYHFPLTFIDQMLDRLAGQEF